VNDATWLAELLAHALVRGSFVPKRPVQQLRDLTRARKQLVRERVQHVQRLQKVLEDANLKLASVISNIVGRSGRALLDAIVAGETDPTVLAQLAHARLEATPEQLAAALQGHLTPHHRGMLQLHLDQLDATDRAIAFVERHVEGALAPFRQAAKLVVTLPGISAAVSAAVVAEIGTDMSRFKTLGHLISWAGLCPRSDESAGKRRSTRIRKGAPWLKPMLVQAAWAAIRVKRSYERVLFYRLKARRGPGRAIIAVAASMLGAIYPMLRHGVPYRDLGADHFEKRDRQQITRASSAASSISATRWTCARPHDPSPAPRRLFHLSHIDGQIAIGPGRRTRSAPSLETATTVDGTWPSASSPPAITSPSPKAATASAAVRQGGAPLRLQLVDTSGAPSARTSAAAVGCGEQRNPTPSSVDTAASTPAGTGTTSVRGPGQCARASSRARCGSPGTRASSAARSGTRTDSPCSSGRPLSWRRRSTATLHSASAPSP
jgi:transposase